MTGLRRAEALIIGGLLALAVAFMSMLFMTPDRWIRLEGLRVSDGATGQNLPIYYEREIVRPFRGEWHVELWRINRGSFEAVCAGNGSWNYEPATPDPNQTLEWLMGGDECAPKVPGEYRVRVIIDVNPRSILARHVVIDSNVFRVAPNV